MPAGGALGGQTRVDCDRGDEGVVAVHGLAGLRIEWRGWLRRFLALGRRHGCRQRRASGALGGVWSLFAGGRPAVDSRACDGSGSAVCKPGTHPQPAGPSAAVASGGNRHGRRMPGAALEGVDNGAIKRLRTAGMAGASAAIAQGSASSLVSTCAVLGVNARRARMVRRAWFRGRGGSRGWRRGSLGQRAARRSGSSGSSGQAVVLLWPAGCRRPDPASQQLHHPLPAPPDTTRRLQDEPARTARTQPSSSLRLPTLPFASLRRCLSFCQRSRPLTNLLSAASHSLSLIPPTPLPTAALRRACSRPLGPPCRAIDLPRPRPTPSLPPTHTHTTTSQHVRHLRLHQLPGGEGQEVHPRHPRQWYVAPIAGPEPAIPADLSSLQASPVSSTAATTLQVSPSMATRRTRSSRTRRLARSPS